jgi:Tfp pilus assembly protein PilE
MKRGFTLIEFMVIAAALAITGAIGWHLLSVHRVKPTRHNLEEARKAVEQHKGQNGAYPESLEALVEKKLLPADVLKDQWGRPLIYRLSAGTAQLLSSGPDGIADNQDDVEQK